MTSPEDIIAGAIWYDHLPTSGARRIVLELEHAGFRIVKRGETVDLPEIRRLYADSDAL